MRECRVPRTEYRAPTVDLGLPCADYQMPAVAAVSVLLGFNSHHFSCFPFSQQLSYLPSFSSCPLSPFRSGQTKGSHVVKYFAATSPFHA